ncbi:MAG: ABC transporter substrate-binding protein [Ottowia sp.]|uniref:ABC transporter substrate-binding protein n=1 Tax=unclassified Ottowia TaxID=2645081 RepID=UPI003C2CD335
MNFKHRAAKWIVPFIALWALSACSPSSDNKESKESANPAAGKVAEVQKLSFMYSPYADYAGFFVAQEKGYFRDAGVEVEMISKAGSSGETFQHVSTGNVTGGGASWAAGLFNATKAGTSMAIVGSVSHIPESGPNPSPLMVSEKSGITDAKQLKGKKIGVPGQGGFGIYSVHLALQSVGLSLADVQLVNLSPGDIIPAMANGSVDASWTIEPISSAVKNKNIGHEILDISYQAGTEIGMIIFNTKFTEEHPDTVAAFVGAYLKAVNELVNGGWQDPEIQKIISKYTDLPVEALKSLALTAPGKDGKINWDDVAKQERFFHDRKVLEYEGNLDMQKIFRADILEKAIKLSQAGAK